MLRLLMIVCLSFCFAKACALLFIHLKHTLALSLYMNITHLKEQIELTFLNAKKTQSYQTTLNLSDFIAILAAFNAKSGVF
ncbi:hypothetical protein DMB91_06430 [Campylobacter sp. MIT 97-5078]|nr:hypothetical protein LR59_12210 [Campylobacter sp. MIT 97-5078]KGI55632.1 hypothetical protein LR59_11140 [Campylobacter sp. MIT 97-5078]KGI57408.1 hypothetical protein LR59_01450 [Campylobacter sp. MIT 97-5078]KGI57415.1 hypothetical protein LR59_01505 [Campylobacter sp. MIT 97-5078]TQR26683.1 hypothetical protein DMB91_06430 [Campylobacter sp. MIT 97-5078]